MSLLPKISGSLQARQFRAELTRWNGNAFVPFLSGISATDVAISHDGEWARFVDYPNMTLWRSRVDGADRMQLALAPEAFLPSWSPDGSKVMFTEIRPGKFCRTLIVSRDGGTPLELVLEYLDPIHLIHGFETGRSQYTE